MNLIERLQQIEEKANTCVIEMDTEENSFCIYLAKEETRLKGELKLLEEDGHSNIIRHMNYLNKVQYNIYLYPSYSVKAIADVFAEYLHEQGWDVVCRYITDD